MVNQNSQFYHQFSNFIVNQNYQILDSKVKNSFTKDHHLQNQELITENTLYQGKRQNLRREDPSREGLDDPMSAWSGSKADTLTDFKLRIKP